MAHEDEAGAASQENPPAIPTVEILAQYVKDFSFENPMAPNSLRADATQPQVQLQVDVRGRRLDEANHFECELRFNIEASRADERVFLVELVYAGVLQLINVSEEAWEPVLMIEGPRFLFPFARRILADATRDGGFPPFMLEPIDWAGLYQRRSADGVVQEGQSKASVS